MQIMDFVRNNNPALFERYDFSLCDHDLFTNRLGFKVFLTLWELNMRVDSNTWKQLVQLGWDTNIWKPSR